MEHSTAGILAGAGALGMVGGAAVAGYGWLNHSQTVAIAGGALGLLSTIPAGIGAYNLISGNDVVETKRVTQQELMHGGLSIHQHTHQSGATNEQTAEEIIAQQKRGLQKKLQAEDFGVSPESFGRVKEAAFAHIAAEEEDTKTFPVMNFADEAKVRSNNGLYDGLSSNELYAVNNVVNFLRADDCAALRRPGMPSKYNPNFQRILDAEFFEKSESEFKKMSDVDKDAYIRWRMFTGFTHRNSSKLVRYEEANVLTRGKQSSELYKLYKTKYDYADFPSNDHLRTFGTLSDKAKENILRKELSSDLVKDVSSNRDRAVLRRKYEMFYDKHLSPQQKTLAKEIYAKHNIVLR